MRSLEEIRLELVAVHDNMLMLEINGRCYGKSYKGLINHEKYLKHEQNIVRIIETRINELNQQKDGR